MPDETLQAAFEIKTTCDEISRKLLRWHWEKKPGAHSLNALLEHIAQRQQESPEYYERMPDLSGKTSWSQLDTTLCMRVLLDPEKDAARPLDLLGNTEHPGAARRAHGPQRGRSRLGPHRRDTGGHPLQRGRGGVGRGLRGHSSAHHGAGAVLPDGRRFSGPLRREKAPCKRGTGRAEGCPPQRETPQRGAAQSFWCRQQEPEPQRFEWTAEHRRRGPQGREQPPQGERQAHKKAPHQLRGAGLAGGAAGRGAAAALVWDERLRRNNEAKTDFSGY